MVEGETPTPLSIHTAVDVAGTPVLVLRGDLDSSNAAGADDAVAAVLGEQPQRLIFDLSGLRFLDSAGIAVLIRAAAQVQVRLRNPSSYVRRALEITGLNRHLTTEWTTSRRARE